MDARVANIDKESSVVTKAENPDCPCPKSTEKIAILDPEKTHFNYTAAALLDKKTPRES